MQNHGLRVTIQNRAKEALELYKNDNNIDLIITDLRMPEMSGQQLIIEVREQEKVRNLPKVPIMVLTGEASGNERVACLSEYGANAYLLKPIKLTDLMASVENLLTEEKSRTSKNILLIDDDAISQRLISKILKQAGESPFSASTIQKAKEEFTANYDKYDIIFLDSELPDGIGLDFMKHFTNTIKEKSLKKPPPVVSMSGNSIPDQQDLYRDYEMYSFLQKPISKTMLLGIIKSVP
eukprot:TRINITY_DN46_c0_g1_i1.p6 TRINITY_DN46_c0_g1~~TRINITY_DN46_c0_g1_i1.p6  ORF type:complete len:237 (-),score=42.11 TRINITY_DN46_c0_g1_i1:2111-2821(-)